MSAKYGPINMTRHGDHSVLRHYCIHSHVYMYTFSFVYPLCIFKTGNFGVMSIVGSDVKVEGLILTLSLQPGSNLIQLHTTLTSFHCPKFSRHAVFILC